MSECITKAGIFYRTKLMTEVRALSFARALCANPRFVSVDAQLSNRAKGPECWFVTFRPVNEACQVALQRRQQLSREERALSQGSEYLWCPDKIGGRAFFWCLSTSGEVYEVAPGHSCTCPDFIYRCQPNGMSCKHIHAIEQGLGTVVDGFQPIPTEQHHAEYARWSDAAKDGTPDPEPEPQGAAGVSAREAAARAEVDAILGIRRAA